MEKTDTIILSPEELVAYMAESTISVTSTYEHSPVVLMVDDTVIGTLGNFSASIGKAKSKKTFNVSAIVASALSGSTVLHYRSMFPENKRKILYMKYPVCTKQGILGIVPNTNIDVEFLYYFMQSSYFQKEVERVVTEGTMKTAYLKDINHIKCPIPDLDRQKEISHLLSVLSLKEDVERQLLQKYQIQKQYLLRKMFI